MKNLLFIMPALIILVSCNKNISENAKLVRIDGNQFEFELPIESKELEEI